MPTEQNQSVPLRKLVPTALRQIPEQFRQVRIALAAAIVFCLLTLGGALILSAVENIPAAYMTRDALQTLHGLCYTGFVSSLGILLWMAAATAGLTAAAVLHGVPDRKGQARFHLCFGLLTLMLTLDDQFLCHEKIWPFFTGLPQFIISGLYALLAAVFLIRFRAVILKSSWLLLGLSLASLGISAVLDTGLLDCFFHSIFVEDSFKLVGIVFWSLYFVHCALNDLRGGAADRYPV
jgi:hypothetical protein